MRQVIVIVIATCLIAYDLFKLNGYYLRLIMTETSAFFRSIETFFLGLF